METGNNKRPPSNSPLAGEDDHKKKKVNEQLLPQTNDKDDTKSDHATDIENSQHELRNEIGTNPGTSEVPLSLDDKVDKLAAKIDKMDNLSEKIDKILGFIATSRDEAKEEDKTYNQRFHKIVEAQNIVAERLEKTVSEVTTLKSKTEQNTITIESNEAALTSIEAQLRVCKATNEEYQIKIDDMESKMKRQSSELVETKRIVLDMGLEVRDRKLAIAGIAESEGEDHLQTVLDCLNTPISAILKQHTPDPSKQSARRKLRTLTLADLDNAYRAGLTPDKKSKRKNPRNIVAVFSFSHIRQMILAIKPLITTMDAKFFISEDLIPEGSKGTPLRSESDRLWC